jgi:hypothetical protein
MVSDGTNCFWRDFYLAIFFAHIDPKFQKHGLWQLVLSSKMSFQLELLSAISGKVFS